MRVATKLIQAAVALVLASGLPCANAAQLDGALAQVDTEGVLVPLRKAAEGD